MREARSNVTPEPVVGSPPTPVATVFGWLCIVFAIIPLALGVQGGSAPYLEAGGALAAVGVVLIAVGRAWVRRRPTSGAS